MKKLIIATIACAFIAGPALASDFAAEQAKVLGQIIAAMDKEKNNPEKLNALTNERNCVETATNAEALQACVAKFSHEQKETTAKK